MDKKRYYIIAAITGILIMLFLFFSSGEEIKSYELNKTDFKETLSASGRVEATNRINMIFQKSGTIAEIYAVEGKYYQKDDPLIILENKEEENEIEGKKLLLRTAWNNLREIENQFEIKSLNNEAAKKSYENIKLLYERNLKLLEVGAVSQKEIEDIQLQMIEAEAKKAIAGLEYKNYAPGGSLRDKALIEIDNVKNQIIKAEIDRNKKLISAPFDGQVLNISKEKYSNVQLGETGIVFAEGKSFITADIDERDYQKVKEGQKAFIQFLDSLESKKGTVRDVSPVIDRTKGTIRVKIDLDDEIALKTDIGVNVEIVVSEFNNEIVIPSEFVFTDPTRIIFQEKEEVFILDKYQKTDGYYVVFDPKLEKYLGKSIISKEKVDNR